MPGGLLHMPYVPFQTPVQIASTCARLRPEERCASFAVKWLVRTRVFFSARVGKREQ